MTDELKKSIDKYLSKHPAGTRYWLTDSGRVLIVDAKSTWPSPACDWPSGVRSIVWLGGHNEGRSEPYDDLDDILPLGKWVDWTGPDATYKHVNQAEERGEKVWLRVRPHVMGGEHMPRQVCRGTPPSEGPLVVTPEMVSVAIEASEAYLREPGRDHFDRRGMYQAALEAALACKGEK
jgi:hypothetical protein